MTDQDPLLLAPAGSGSDYTNIRTRALRGEPECIDPDAAERFALDFQMRRSRAHLEQLQRQALQLQLLRGSLTDMKVRQLLKLAARNLLAAEKRLNDVISIEQSHELAAPEGIDLLHDGSSSAPFVVYGLESLSDDLEATWGLNYMVEGLEAGRRPVWPSKWLAEQQAATLVGTWRVVEWEFNSAQHQVVSTADVVIEA